MKKAKELAKEYLDHQGKQERTEFYMEGLKPAINNLLHMYLPDDITMQESEVLALVINDMIWHPYDFVRQDDSHMLYHECPECGWRCNCSNQPCSCCLE